MKTIDKLILKIAGFFSTDAYAKAVRNQIGHYYITYAETRSAIAEAKKVCTATVEAQKTKFAKARRGTLDKTLGAIEKIKQEAEDQVEAEQERHAKVTEKLNRKANEASNLSQLASKLGSSEFPLE